MNEDSLGPDVVGIKRGVVAGSVGKTVSAIVGFVSLSIPVKWWRAAA
jgi:hypothetical protein